MRYREIVGSSIKSIAKPNALRTQSDKPVGAKRKLLVSPEPPTTDYASPRIVPRSDGRRIAAPEVDKPTDARDRAIAPTLHGRRSSRWTR
jgi:hypothetical protein